MSSAIQEKSNIAIILAIVISSSGYVLGNTDDAITQDAVNEIRNDIKEIKSDQKQIRSILTIHELKGAHPHAEAHIENLQNLVGKLDNRVRDIELFGTKKLN